MYTHHGKECRNYTTPRPLTLTLPLPDTHGSPPHKLTSVRRPSASKQERLVQWIEYLVDNLRVRLCDRIMRQVVGVPVGTRCSLWLANLTLLMYELEYFSSEMSKLAPWEIHDNSAKWKHIRNMSFYRVLVTPSFFQMTGPK